jgi:predicted Fe-Mo cluster-binding NifX family protein
MKIAVPTVGDQVDQHFGHCEKYSIFTIEEKTIKAEEFMESPHGCGCKSDMAVSVKKRIERLPLIIRFCC